MNDIITVRGYVATEVRLTLAQSGLPIAGFRMCSTDRRFDKESNAWIDGNTNWYSVSMFRQLATNGAASLRKGDRVVIAGRLRVRPWINAEGRTGTSVDIDADTAGHDLMWGTANFKRTSTDRTDVQGQVPAALEDMPAGVNPATGEMLGAEETDYPVDPDPDGTPEGDDGAHGAAANAKELDAAGAPF
ncbi:single-stranded DNA-binding protein [Arthrobacter sp. Br18]|uniref:single-stranded DNA-binding protein n=1 Tax=Arthrobacter sp. Br18 TaxID=1312954 RepID=UPI0004AEC356|nr:single-stranded DNA-binding protein [Arthrobacter sp. Br18]